MASADDNGAPPPSSGGGLPAFCASGSEFGPGVAEGFARWAKERLRFPPSEELHKHLELRLTGGLGVHAAAARSFSCGELVLSEEPLLRVPDAPLEVRRRLQASYGEKAAFLAPSLGVDWRSVSEDEQAAALSLFYAHPSMAASESKQVQHNLKACSDIIAGSSLQGRLEAFDLLRFLHVVDLNIHRDDEVAKHAGFAGIFVFGSKFSHSCAPNCSWSFSPEGRLQYHAIRPIGQGELFTFSYIGNGMNLLTSTIERRRRLSSLWFVCQCARCLGPDLSRRMRCPRCGDDAGCLPEYSEATCDPAQHGVPDAEHWRCSACGASPAAAELPLRDEADLMRLVPEAMMKGGGGPGSPAMEARLFERLRARAASTVGPQHWTHALASFAWLQRGLAVLERDPVVFYGEEEFQGVSRHVARWLESNAPENSEQRMSALFATVRLEQNLGGGLNAWGYDPADPLGGGLESAKRLADHGWQLASEGCTRGSGGAAAGKERGGTQVYSSGAPVLSEGPGLSRVRQAPRCLGSWQ